MQPMSYCPQCGHPVPTAISGPVVCQNCGTVIQPQNAPTIMSPGPAESPMAPYPYTNPAAATPPPFMPAANVPPTGPTYPYPNVPPATPSPLMPAMTPALSADAAPPPQPAPGGYTPYPSQPMPGAPMPMPTPAPAPYGYSYPGTPQPPERRTNPVLTVGIVAIIVILVAAGVAFALSRSNNPTASTTPTPTATTAPTATATTSSGGNLTTFTDPNNFYSIGIPSGWTHTDKSSGGTSEQLFQDPQSGAVAEIAYLSGTQPPATSDDQFMSGIGQISNKQGPTDVSNAGETWAQETGDTTLGGQSEHVDVLATNHGGNVIIIAFLGPSSSFDTLSSVDFVPMQQSFQFAS